MDMYDSFSEDYDRFVNWPSRLRYEMPFIEARLEDARPGPEPSLRVLDAACGTGMHAIALAERGYTLTGADLSEPMVQRARRNAQDAGVQARFETAGFGDLTSTFGQNSFDALLCMGNSLPHVPDDAGLSAALGDFAACLAAGGLLLVQNRNFDLVMAQKSRWMEPQSQREGEREWLFQRFYDFAADGSIDFNVITLRREGLEAWTQTVASTRLYPLTQSILEKALFRSGFSDITYFGDMNAAHFDRESSGNLILTARMTAGQ